MVPFKFLNSIVYDLGAFEDLERFAVTHPAVPARYRDECRNEGMGVAFAQTAIDRYHRDYGLVPNFESRGTVSICFLTQRDNSGNADPMLKSGSRYLSQQVR